MSEVPLYAEDLAVGDTVTFDSYLLTKEELVSFATQWDPQGFHIDDAVAAAGPFGQVIASGIHTMAVFQRLSILSAERHWAVIAGKRLAEVRFIRPVLAGMRLTGGVRIADIRFEPDRQRALLVKDGWLETDDGPVMRLLSEAYLHTRPAS